MADRPGAPPFLVQTLLQPTRFSIALFVLLLASLTLGTVSIGETHTRHGLFCGALFLIMVGPFLWCLLFGRLPPRATQLFRARWLWVALLVIVGTVDQLHYRSAEQGNDPLTSSLALELPAEALLHGMDPYGVHLVHGAPISPGPGWIVLLMPLTAFRLTGFLGMLLLGFATFRVAARSRLAAGVFLFILLCCPLFQSQAANGQDLYAISLACAALCLLLERASDHLPLTAAVSTLAGFVATSRMPFLVVLLIPGIGLWRVNRRAGLLYCTLMPSVALLLNGGFALWAARSGDWFQPMHIFARGTAAAGHGAQLSVALLLAGALGWVALRMRGSASDWMLGMWFVLTALFLPEALKEFKQAGHDLRWEGSSYATFALPLLAAALVLRSRILGRTAPAGTLDTERGTSASWSVGE